MSEGKALVQRTPNKASSSRSPSADARSRSRRDRSLRGESAAHPLAEPSPAGFEGSHVDLATYDYYDLDAPRARVVLPREDCRRSAGSFAGTGRRPREV